jgi:RNA 3'-terminal phosphate cyclase (ATP)
MDWQPRSAGISKKWTLHGGHDVLVAPHVPVPAVKSWNKECSRVSSRLITLDGSQGEGGGQILRTALTLSLLTGRPFRIVKIRANREKPGLRPQHLAAVHAAAELGNAELQGASVGSRDLIFRPGEYEPRDFAIDIGTAGSTSLVLQTLHLPLALRAEKAVRVELSGGTFNPRAPAFPFLRATWKGYLDRIGAPIAVAMPAAGFYPRGGGRLDAWIEPARLRPFVRTERGAVKRVRGVAGVLNLRPDIPERMRDRALARLDGRGWDVAIELADWPGPGQGAAISLTIEHERTAPATFVGLGERGKPSEVVADEAVGELLAFDAATDAAVDAHSADQILLPLALTPGRSEYTVAEVTEHLRTNVATIQQFVDRTIAIQEPSAQKPGRVVVV